LDWIGFRFGFLIRVYVEYGQIRIHTTPKISAGYCIDLHPNTGHGLKSADLTVEIGPIRVGPVRIASASDPIPSEPYSIVYISGPRSRGSQGLFNQFSAKQNSTLVMGVIFLSMRSSDLGRQRLCDVLIQT
jgi:hypothetical protein